jgi:hypothetical protein
MASRRERARNLNFGEAPFLDPTSAATQPENAQGGSDFDSSLYKHSDTGIASDRAKLVQHSSFNPSANAWVPSMADKVSIFRLNFTTFCQSC